MSFSNTSRFRGLSCSSISTAMTFGGCFLLVRIFSGDFASDLGVGFFFIGGELSGKFEAISADSKSA